MCGIAGIYDLSGQPVSLAQVQRMTDAIVHRGPDGQGQLTEENVGLGHRRLAVIDLTPAAAQPMASRSGHCVLVYNGEVYNYQSLRAELQALGYRFNSTSDTEVVLNAYEAWGERCVERFNGMFAFAIWDRRTRRLFLARDRYGVKPLYYAFVSGVFLFGSEIKAMLTHPRLSAGVDIEALDEYFTFQNILSDRTLFANVRVLPAGCTMIVGPDASHAPSTKRYWDYRFDSRGFDLTEDETTQRVQSLFEQAVTRQLVSDVPVGSYLSGGIDSGSITAVSARHIPRIHTFTCGFDLSSASGLEMGFDERPVAEVMANLFKTEHYEVVLHAGDMEHVLPELIWHLEDLRVGQCYPNYYVARLASKFVKVVLSGSGGDEVFAGYPWRYYRGNPGGDVGTFASQYFNSWQRLLPGDARRTFFREDVARRLGGHEPAAAFRDVLAGSDLPLDSVENAINASLYFECKTFLHGLFIVEDKLSMAHSLESRVPFMDNDLVDFALTIPPRFKLRQLLEKPSLNEDETGTKAMYRHVSSTDGKIVLREAMNRLIPDSVRQRAKQGFSAPDASWFRGESVGYVNRLLRDKRARIYDFLDPAAVERVLDEHVSGTVNRRLLIWSMLSFEWWCRAFMDR
jgi:asparagine synthase (glutamine-hydrolysing)